MAVSERIVQIFEDAYFLIVNALDNTKQLLFNLSGAVTGKTLTVVSNHTENRTLALPDKNGTLDTIQSIRSTLGSNVLDYGTAEIVFRSLSSNETLTINSPVIGKTVTLELLANNFNFLFPPSCKVLSGRIKPETTNYIYFHCIDDSPATYIVTIGQQSA